MVFNGAKKSAGMQVVAVLDKAVNVVIALVLVLMFAVGCYDWWDSRTVDQAASAQRWQAYKPLGDSSMGFAELQALNPDVVGWLELYGTGVDYPVCYSEDQGYYLDHDATKKGSMTGSLFLDRHNSSDFSDLITIMYGHHMQSDRMFGPLSNFEQAGYFDEHEYGNLHTDGADNGLDIFACVRADAYDMSLFRTGHSTAAERDAQVDAWLGEPLQTREVHLDADDRVLVMSTCSDALTNARTVLLAKICDETFENPFAELSNTGTGVDAMARLFGLPWYAWVALAVLIALATSLVVVQRRGKEQSKSADEAEAPHAKGGDAR